MTPQQLLEFVNAGLAITVLLLGVRFLRAIRFVLQRRAVELFLAAIALFALIELSEPLARMLSIDGVEIEIAKELVETLLILCIALALYFMRKSDQDEVGSLKRSATTDGLTGLLNQAAFRRALRLRVRERAAGGAPLSLLMIDVDDFKAYNDAHGHEAGNTALCAVADVLQRSVRGDDTAARYGGEEFVVLVNDRLERAGLAGERLRCAIAAQCDPKACAALRRPVTVSIGVAELEAPLATAEDLINAADARLYCAKRAGKNRVAISPGLALEAIAELAVETP